MATVYADSQDGYITRFNQSSWSNARATTTGTNSSSTIQNVAFGVGAWAAAARGGGTILVFIGLSFSSIHQEFQAMYLKQH